MRWSAVVDNCDWHLTAPMLVALAAALHTDVGTLTLAMSAHALGYGLALPLWGRAADRFGPRRVLRTGLVLAVAMFLLTALSPSLMWWLVLRTLTGAALACVTPAVSLHQEMHTNASARQRSFASLMAATAASAIVTPLVVDIQIRTGSWRLVFVSMALLAGVALLCTGRLAHLERPARLAGPRVRGVVRRGRAYWTVLGLGAGEGAVMMGLPNLLPSALVAGGAGGSTSLLVVTYALSVLLGSFVVARQARCWSPKRLVGVGGLLGTLAALFAAVHVYPLTLLVAAVLLGWAWGCFHTTLQTWVPRAFPAHARGTAASLMATSAVLASAVTLGAAAPLLAHGSTQTLFICAAGLCTVLTGCAMRTARDWR